MSQLPTQPVPKPWGSSTNSDFCYQNTHMEAGDLLHLCLWKMCRSSSPLTALPERAPGSGVEDTAGVHPSKQGAAHPCSWWMAAVPSTARHLLGENVQEQINPSALDNLTSKRKGDAPWPHIFLLTPLDWFEHAKWSMHKAVCQVTAFFTRVFFLYIFARSPTGLFRAQQNPSRNGDFYARLTHRQVFKADWNWLGSKANEPGAAGIRTKGLSIHWDTWCFLV